MTGGQDSLPGTVSSIEKPKGHKPDGRGLNRSLSILCTLYANVTVYIWYIFGLKFYTN